MMRAEEYSFFKNGLGLTQRAVKIVLGNSLVTTILMCVSLLPSNSLFFFLSFFPFVFRCHRRAQWRGQHCLRL